MRILIASLIVLMMPAVDAFAGRRPVEVSVPTLGEWGMIAMFAVLGIVGFIALRKRMAAQTGK